MNDQTSITSLTAILSVLALTACVGAGHHHSGGHHESTIGEPGKAAGVNRTVRIDMSDAPITRYKLDPNNPPKTDWAEADKLTDDEVRAAALSDPDAQPATSDQFARARRVVRVEFIPSGAKTRSVRKSPHGFPLTLCMISANEK